MSDWKPSASIDNLKARARLLALVRQFFADKGIWEVETPLLARHSVTDPYMKSFAVAEVLGEKAFLQTSPEYAMKRLLAAGSGSIYQICKSFRQDESGGRHSPEFTMLEWYQLDFGHHQLIAQVYDLLRVIFPKIEFQKISYQQVFIDYLALDPLSISDSELKAQAEKLLGQLPADLQRDDYLALLFEDKIEPFLGKQGSLEQEKICATFVVDYPASQASLARLDKDNPQVACRFELYIDGMELANGFYELQDAKLQLARFEQDNLSRKALGLEQVSIDKNLIEALEHGLPHCSGVALGIDRLLMLQLGASDISEVLSFNLKRN